MVLVSPGPVRAAMVMSVVIGVPELVMNAFSPSSTHSSPSRVAFVRRPPASLPASGSVSPNAASAVPEHSSGSQRCFWASLPKRWIGVAPEPDRGLQGDGERLVDPGDLLDGDAQRGQVAATPAVLLGEGQTEQPQRAHLLHGVDREGVVPVPRLGVRRDLGIGEVPHQRTQRLLLGRGVEERHRGHGSGGGWGGRRAASPNRSVRRPPPPAAGGPPCWTRAAPR